MGIVEFLEARIAEDEADARAADEGRLLTWSKNDHMVIVDSGFIQTFTPSRVLREVAAKRAIIKAYVDADIKAHDTYNFHEDILNGEFNGLETAVEALAICWSDHPDFDEEWRP